MNKNQLISKDLQALLFFGGESIQMLIVYLAAISSLWLWMDFISPPIKGIITFLIILNYYNIAKHFIYVRYTLWKQESNNNSKYN
jgi:hypothetical protein